MPTSTLSSSPAGLLLRILGKTSLVLPTLYVLGFIYLKTYLAHFGFDIELASLSITNLLLAHRYFVGQDFFLMAGLLQAYLVLQVRARNARQPSYRLRWPERVQFVLVLLSPFLLIAVGYPLSIWTEARVAVGYNPANLRLLAPMTLGWVSGLTLSFLGRHLLRGREWSFSYALWVLAALCLVSVSVFSYRLFAFEVAADRLARNNFQTIRFAEKAGASPSAPPLQQCAVLYVDSQSLFLRCGSTYSVHLRSALPDYTLLPNFASP